MADSYEVYVLKKPLIGEQFWKRVWWDATREQAMKAADLWNEDGCVAVVRESRKE